MTSISSNLPFFSLSAPATNKQDINPTLSNDTDQRDYVLYGSTGNPDYCPPMGYGYRHPETIPSILAKSDSAAISLVTEDGDIVSISKLAVAAHSREYSYTGRPDLARGSETFTLKSQELSDYTITTLGDINEEEQKEIEALLIEFKSQIDAFFDSSTGEDVTELGALTTTASVFHFSPNGQPSGLYALMDYADNIENQQDAYRLSMSINDTLEKGKYKSLAAGIVDKHSRSYSSEEKTIAKVVEPVQIFNFMSESEADAYYFQQQPNNVYDNFLPASQPEINADDIVKYEKEKQFANVSALYNSVQSLKVTLNLESTATEGETVENYSNGIPDDDIKSSMREIIQNTNESSKRITSLLPYIFDIAVEDFISTQNNAEDSEIQAKAKAIKIAFRTAFIENIEQSSNLNEG